MPGCLLGTGARCREVPVTTCRHSLPVGAVKAPTRLARRQRAGLPSTMCPRPSGMFLCSHHLLETANVRRACAWVEVHPGVVSASRSIRGAEGSSSVPSVPPGLLQDPWAACSRRGSRGSASEAPTPGPPLRWGGPGLEPSSGWRGVFSFPTAASAGPQSMSLLRAGACSPHAAARVPGSLSDCWVTRGEESLEPRWLRGRWALQAEREQGWHSRRAWRRPGSPVFKAVRPSSWAETSGVGARGAGAEVERRLLSQRAVDAREAAGVWPC